MHPQEPFHIAGSDASGIVWKVGSAVTRWKEGDEVVLHCNQSCLQCPECTGGEPLACLEQRIWGYEANWGAFAQFTKVQAQQLLPKPRHLSWEEAASYGLTLFTAYRMLVTQAEMRAGESVLVWGAGGGLGIFAVQLCRLAGARAIGVVSSDEKAELVKSLGAAAIIDRREFDFGLGQTEWRRFGRRVKELNEHCEPDIVFEHVGKETLGVSLLVARRFGRIVTCGATTGYESTLDLRHLWVRQKRLLGSHFANSREADAANRLVMAGKLRPIVDRVFAFEETALAHQLMSENRHKGKMVIRVQAGSLR
jgi:crotonyl-CoA carboxylase/reductase